MALDFLSRFARRSLLALGCLLGFAGASYAQQSGPCPTPTDLRTNVMPEIASNGAGITAGEMVLHDDFRALPGTATSAGTNCTPQLLRYFGTGASAAPPASGAIAPSPQLGPTIRANLGDVVELSFLNQIDPLDYPQSVDSGEKSGQCDTSSKGYPVLAKGPPVVTDTYPNCFHGSTTANIHFHGTHTSPITSGDNVFVAVTPSPRVNGQPVVTSATFQSDYKTFFTNCAKALQANPLNQYPAFPTALGPWPAAKGSFWDEQLKYLKMVNANWPPTAADLAKLDEASLNAKQWPPYYAGSYPYCMVLPRYNPAVMPSLKMGQSPGTHWYHAHKHGSTAINLFNGMSGAFIIEDNAPAAVPGGAPGYDYYFNNGTKVGSYTFAGYNSFRGQLGLSTTKTWSQQQPILILNEFGGTPSLESGAGGPLLPVSVNGMPNATMTMQPGEVKLWRIVNASPIVGIYITAASFPSGFTWQQTAQDGVQFDDSNFLGRSGHAVFVAPGNRIDVLVKAPATPTASVPFNVIFGKSAANALAKASTQQIQLFAIKVAGNAITGMNLPEHLAPRPIFLTDINTTGLGINRSMVFDSSGGGGQRLHTINGAKFDPSKPQETVQLGKTEQWLIANSTVVGGIVDHPFHIHVNPFQVTGVFAPNASVTNAAGQPVAGTPLYVFNTSVQPGQPRSTYWVTANGAYTGQCLANPTPTTTMPGPAPPPPPNNPTWTPPGWNPTWVPCDAPPAGTNVAGPMPAPTAGRTNIWWDVFPIPAGIKIAASSTTSFIVPGYFTMASNFVDYQGEFVLHCHILAHEDRGMMMSVEVTPNCKNGICTPSRSAHALHH